MLRTCNPNGYRAKCEFRVGFDEVTNERVVGFKGAKAGVLSVQPGDKMIQLPHQMKLVVKVGLLLMYIFTFLVLRLTN